MTLLKLCDPLFKYVCFLNRSARKGVAIDAAQAEAEVETILSETRAKAAVTPGLLDQYEKVELPLIFFVDNVIVSGPPPLCDAWQRIAYKRDRVTGDTDFCDELDATLAEPESASATERLGVFYTCVGLGFTGDRLGEPTVRQQRMSQMSRRLRPFMEVEDRSRVTPQAYAHTLTDDLVPPPVAPVWKLAVALVGLLLMLVVLNGYLYRNESQKLTKTLDAIQSEERR